MLVLQLASSSAVRYLMVLPLVFSWVLFGVFYLLMIDSHTITKRSADKNSTPHQNYLINMNIPEIEELKGIEIV